MVKTNQYFPQSRPHPGEILSEKLDEMGMGPKEFAVRTNKPEQTITAVLNGDSSITPDMAVQFEKVTQIPVSFWLTSQQHFDEYRARLKYQEDLKEAQEWTRRFPTLQMAKLGWIESSRDYHEKTMYLFNFFGISNKESWRNLFLEGKLKVQFRISLANTNEPYALSAWLRRGEIQANALNVSPYSKAKFTEALPQIKAIMASHPPDFFEKLQKICLSAGVKVVHTPCLPKAPINGATRWFKDSPLIQLSGRHKRNDIFWFTFFHEAGHILLHGKKDIFLENVEYDAKEIEKEKEADEFAVKWTLDKAQEKEITSLDIISDEQIISFAENFGTHPGIIVGRLQYLGLIKQSEGNDLKEVVNLDEH